MFISSAEWWGTQQRIEECERQIRELRAQTHRELKNMAKKILEHPEEMREEIAGAESIEKFIDDFMRS